MAANSNVTGLGRIARRNQRHVRRQQQPLRRSFRQLVLLLGILLLGFGGWGMRYHWFTLVAPHRTMPNPPMSSEDRVVLASALDAAELPEGSLRAARRFSLDFVAQRFHFGRDHASFLGLGDKGREAHCVEYAWLFSRTFAVTARHLGVEASAVPLRSPVRIFGAEMPIAGLNNHDWVRIDLPDGDSQYVDPCFADWWLGWNIELNVQ